MKQRREWHGKWWPPDKPSDQVDGTLTCDDEDGIVLVLRGQFGGIKESPKSTDDAFLGYVKEQENETHDVLPIILGEDTQKGEILTLANCHKVGQSTGFRHTGFSILKYDAHILLKGAQYDTPDEIGEPRYELDLSCLQEWIAVSGNKTKEGRRENDEGVVLRYSLPDDIEISSGRFPFRIQFWSSMRNEQFEVGLKQHAMAVYQKDKPISLKESFAFTRNLTDFMTFVSQRQAWVTRSEYAFPAHEEKLRDYYDKVELVNPSFCYLEGKEVQAHEMLFTFPDVRDRIGDMWDKWCWFEAELRPILHYYLGNLVQPSTYTFHRILNLSRAAEVFHRKMVEKKDGNLRQRFEDFWDRQPSHIQRLLGEKNLFAENASMIRNYYTHYNRKYEKDTVSEVTTAYRLHILLTSALLQGLGFSHKEIDAMAQDWRKQRAFRLPKIVMME